MIKTLSVAAWTPALVLAGCVLLSQSLFAQEDASNKTVIGPTNVPLSEGVELLKNGDAKAALPLLKQGLRRVTADRHFAIALSNICAAYVLLEDYPAAISYCTRALEMNPRFWRAMNNRALAHLGAGNYPAADADIRQGMEISPNASSLSKTRLRYQQIVEPLVPVIVIDDRRIEEVPIE